MTWLQLLLAASLAGLCLLISGCDLARKPKSMVTDIEDTQKLEKVEQFNVETAKKRVIYLENELTGAKRDLVLAEEHQMAIRCYWIAGILALLALTAAVGAWFLPVLKGRLAAAAVALAGLAAACYWLGQHAWVVPWIGGLVILAGVLYAIYEIRRGHVATRLASEFGDQAEDLAKSLGLAADDPRLLAMKVQAAAKQAGAGIHSLLDRIRS